MNVVKVKLNRPGVRELLRSAEVEADLARRARNIADAAGGQGAGFESESDVSRTRARAWAWTETPEAMRAEAERRVLTSAIDAGRD